MERGNYIKLHALITGNTYELFYIIFMLTMYQYIHISSFISVTNASYTHSTLAC